MAPHFQVNARSVRLFSSIARARKHVEQRARPAACKALAMSSYFALCRTAPKPSAARRAVLPRPLRPPRRPARPTSAGRPQTRRPPPVPATAARPPRARPATSGRRARRPRRRAAPTALLIQAPRARRRRALPRRCCTSARSSRSRRAAVSPPGGCVRCTGLRCDGGLDRLGVSRACTPCARNHARHEAVQTSWNQGRRAFPAAHHIVNGKAWLPPRCGRRASRRVARRRRRMSRHASPRRWRASARSLPKRRAARPFWGAALLHGAWGAWHAPGSRARQAEHAAAHVPCMRPRGKRGARDAPKRPRKLALPRRAAPRRPWGACAGTRGARRGVRRGRGGR